MRRFVLSLISTAAVLVPVVAFAQADQVITSPPSVTAAGADWQTGGVPVLYNGETYQPTGSRVFFDANVMVKVGTFRGVPFYADRTREPNTIVYVPVSGGQVRAYERRASRELEGTVDSRVPEIPGDSASAPESWWARQPQSSWARPTWNRFRGRPRTRASGSNSKALAGTTPVRPSCILHRGSREWASIMGFRSTGLVRAKRI